MQVSVEICEGLERKLNIAVPADKIDIEVKNRIISTAKKIRLDGFRPGKVPIRVIKQRFGDSIRAEVLNEIASKSFQQAVSQEDLKPVSEPLIEPIVNEEGEDFQFFVTFDIYPEIELSNCSDLVVQQFSASVNDQDIDSMISKLRDQQVSWVDVDRKSINGDQLNIDFDGKINGESFEGGNAKSNELILGSNSMIPGFESGLEGMSSGESKILSLAFPEDYHSEDLRGKDVEFSAIVNKVQEKNLPELDSDFFAKFEVEGDIDQFKSHVKENMEKQLKSSLENYNKHQVLDALFEKNSFTIPKAMIESEISNLQQQTLSQFGASADKFDLSLLPRDLFEDKAKKRVALGVIMSKAVTNFSINPDRGALLEYLDDLAISYDEPEKFKAHYLGDETRMQELQLILVEKKVVESILDEAKVSEKNVSYDELMEAAQALNN